MGKLLIFILLALSFWGCKATYVADTNKATDNSWAFRCDSLEGILNTIYPHFSQKWKSDSLGCDRFRMIIFSLKSLFILKDWSSTCVENVLGIPNSIVETEEKKIVEMSYILSQNECEGYSPYYELNIIFNEQGFVRAFGVVLE
ncbi:MAG: hypothetical protein R3D00_18030 [Bacteroidia bacterium]